MAPGDSDDVPTVTVAEYLATRLTQSGVRHLFGVPGDFSLGLLDALDATGLLTWVGTANELDAGYAADGYARRRGLGALVTTYGVGELSAINAVAGSYAEHVPVVEVTGAPATRHAAAGALLHHTLGDGDFGRFTRAYTEVTGAVGAVTAPDAAGVIDRVLAVALTRLRPVHLSVPMDVVTAPVDAAGLSRPLPGPAGVADPAAVERFTQAARRLLGGGGPGDAGIPVVIAGHLVQRLGAEGALRELVEAGGLPAVSLVMSKGVLDEDHPLHRGVYCGRLGDPVAARVVDEAPVLITVGVLMADVVSGFFTHRQDPARTVALDVRSATVAGEVVDGVPLPVALEVLTHLVAERRAVPASGARPAAVDDATSSAGRDATSSAGSDAAAPATALTQDALWAAIERALPPGCALVADIGTAFWGAIGIGFPADTVFVAQPVWSSIGYALPATLGCALADPAHRPVLVIGDGAAQMTVAELGTLLQRAPGLIVILINNDGYTIERALQSPDAGYNDVVRWDWAGLARSLAPDAAPLVLRADTELALVEALARAVKETGRATLLEVITEPLDLPPLMRALAAAVRGRR